MYGNLKKVDFSVCLVEYNVALERTNYGKDV